MNAGRLVERFGAGAFLALASLTMQRPLHGRRPSKRPSAGHFRAAQGRTLLLDLGQSTAVSSLTPRGAKDDPTDAAVALEMTLPPQTASVGTLAISRRPYATRRWWPDWSVQPAPIPRDWDTVATSVLDVVRVIY